MSTFLAALLVFLLAFAALAVGLFFRRPPLKRNCGNPVECRCAAEGKERAEFCGETSDPKADRCTRVPEP